MQTENFSAALRLAVNHSGEGVLSNAPLLLALLGDYAPRLRQERDAIGMAFSLQITEQLAAAVSSPPDEQARLLWEGAAQICRECAALDENPVYIALSCYAEVLGCRRTPPSPLMIDPDPLFNFLDDVGGEVFARWAADGAYYPATVYGRVGNGHVKVTFMDGVDALVGTGEVVEIDEALVTMKLWADWERRGGYYPCKLQSQPGEPVIVRYDADGVIEQVSVSQLRVTL